MALWIVATPIGTLSDLSPRAREVLASAAVIAAEDTRTTRKLLAATGIESPPLVALHAHNEDGISQRLAERALTEEVVVVSDAGTPGISDPGTPVIAAAHRIGARIRSVPGPSALAAALAASGFPAVPSTFIGFPPRKGRDGFAAEVLARPEAVVIYEAPTRIGDLVERLAALAPTREAALCREISKHYEEIRRAPLAEMVGTFEEVRGECVLVVGPGEATIAEAPVLGDDVPLGAIAQALAHRWGCSRKEAYDALLKLERSR
jgi:16S rRNA (cytidine1402-2'-O)-methyltransferase